MTYKALLLDLDGTTIPNKLEGLPSQKVITAISSAQEYVHVGVATSRCFGAAREAITQLSLQSYSIFSGGARIIDLTRNEHVYKKPLTDATAEEVCTVLSSFKVPFYMCINDTDSLYQKEPIKDCFMIYLLEVEPELVEEIVDSLAHITTASIHRVPDWKANKFSLTITHTEATKQHGVVEVATLLGINPHEIIGVGDGYNDFPLLMACGLKVAMGNAVDDLKEIADYIAPPVEDDGVADVIKKFILNQK